MSLYAPAASPTVVGSQDQIILNSASSAVSGNDDIIYEQGASSAQVSGEGDVIVERETSSAQVNGGDNSIYQYGASTVNRSHVKSMGHGLRVRRAGDVQFRRSVDPWRRQCDIIDRDFR